MRKQGASFPIFRLSGGLRGPTPGKVRQIRPPMAHIVQFQGRVFSVDGARSGEKGA